MLRRSHCSDSNQEHEASTVTSLMGLRKLRCPATTNTATQELTKNGMVHTAREPPQKKLHLKCNRNSPVVIAIPKSSSIDMVTTQKVNDMKMSSIAHELIEQYSTKDISDLVRCLSEHLASPTNSANTHASTDVNKMPPSGITTPYLPLNFNNDPMPFSACNEASDNSVVSDISDSEMVVAKRKDQKFTPNEHSWTEKWVEARHLVTKTKQFSKVEERKIRQWMHNCRKAKLNDEMIKKAWSIVMYTMYHSL